MQSSIASIVYDEEHKGFIKYCNTLRCPLCNSQLDGNIHKRNADLYCVYNNEEYKCILTSCNDIDLEQFTFWYSQYQYTVCVSKVDNTYLSTVDRYNMDAILRLRTKKEIFRYKGERLLFFRTRMEEDIFLKKLQLYNVFS